LVYNHVREELDMCDALRELFKDELEKERASGREQGRKSDIVTMLRNGKTAAQIADFCSYPIEEVREVENEMLEGR
jgi:predicted transposase YdaD